MMAQKPLMLKDYLALDCESSGSGFQCAPRWAAGGAVTLRRLLQAELRSGSNGSDARLVRPPSKNALTKISAVINTVKLLQFSPSSSSSADHATVSPSRIFLKKIRAGFWKKRPQRDEDQEEEEKSQAKRVRDIVRLPSFASEDAFDERRSFAFPSPVVSSCSSWSETSSTPSDSLPSTGASYGNLDEIAVAIVVPVSSAEANKYSESALGVGEEVTDDTGAGGKRAQKEVDRKRTESMECLHRMEEEDEKQHMQLSPVSVMDFPCEDEEEDGGEERNSSPSFRESLANIERKKLHLLQKIKRFESLAQLVDPVNLEECFDDVEVDPSSMECSGHVAPSEDEDEEEETSKARGLLGALKSNFKVSPQGSIEKLLLDFFIQGLSYPVAVNPSRPFQWGNRIATPSVQQPRVPEELLTAARDWMDGIADDCLHGTGTIREMEKNGRWRCFDDEEMGVGLDLEGVLLECLLEELALDLASF